MSEDNDWCLVCRDTTTKDEAVLSFYPTYSKAIAKRDDVVRLGQANGAALAWINGRYARILSVNWCRPSLPGLCGLWEYEVCPTTTAINLGLLKEYGVQW